MAGKTVRIYLKDGSPNSLLIAEILNWTGIVLVVPRSQLVKLAERKEVKQTGLYVLAGPDLDVVGRERVYIGESDDVWTRLQKHNNDSNKDFWVKTIIITSKDANLTKAHVRYLESCLIELAQQAQKANVTNSTNPPKPSLPESDVDDMNFFLEQIQMLLPVLGFLFIQTRPSSDDLRKIPSTPLITDNSNASTPLLVLSVKKKYAEAKEVDGEFIVFKGSYARSDSQPSLGKTGTLLREQLYREGKFRDEEAGDLWIFTEDVPFSSLSAAASVITGTQTNGLIAWKVKDHGMTYKGWQQMQIENINKQFGIQGLDEDEDEDE